jgi:cold shock protein
MRGRVKWFSYEKGYGFITDERAKDYYFAVRDLVGSDLPSSGDEVEFNAESTERGLRATNVRITKANPARGDERETCEHCGKKMVPRLITYQGQVQRSVCPYCGETHRRFAIPRFLLMILAIVAFAILREC